MIKFVNSIPYVVAVAMIILGAGIILHIDIMIFIGGILALIIALTIFTFALWPEQTPQEEKEEPE